jgi:hypothetical protein
MKNKLFVTMLLLILWNIGSAQDPDLEKYLKRREGVKYPNIIKINSLAIAFSNASLIYERALAPRVAVNIGVGYKYAGGLPRLFESDDNTMQLQINNITGYSVTPELRYYLKTCDSRLLDGFYGGIYFRYTRFTSNAKFDYFPAEHDPQYYKADAFLSEVGGGITLGYQLLLWERLSIDFLFFGPRYSFYNIGYEFDSGVSQEFLDELSGKLNEVIDRFGIDYTVELKQEGENNASNSFGFGNVRFGISIGFAF